MKYFFTFLFVIVCVCTHAQNPDLKRTWHWYFGDKAGLDFSSGTAMPDTNGQMSVLERSAVISDTSGNLLFYTDGHQVWNRNHQIMQNGDSLGLYFPTPRDASVIIPKPDSDSIYYIFNVDGWENQFQRGIRWHEVDMSLDNGLGTVTSKNNLLYAPVTEQLAATRHANGCDYWVVTHERSSDRFLAFRITAEGVDSVPVVSAAGQDYGVTQQSYNLNGGYHFVFSPNGGKALVQVIWNYPITGLPEQIQLMDFNVETGAFTNAFDLPVDTSTTHGFFSPDGSKIYIEMGFDYARLYQFDLASGIEATIIQSKTLIHANNPYYGIALDGQITPDGKVYTTVQNINPYPRDALSVIENPNASGVASNVMIFAQSLNGRWAGQGLPNFVSNFLVNELHAPCQYTFIYEENNNEMKNTLVFPNPADDRIIVSNNNFQTGNVTARIIDITGRVWLEYIMKQDEKEFALNVSQIPNGFYLLELHTAKSRKAFRIFIHHQNSTP